MYSTENSGYVGNGWGPLWGGVIGAIGGYLVGRNINSDANGNCGNASCGAGCQTCFQQGEYTGENRAGIDYIAQQVSANAQEIRAVNANVNARFDAILQQKIADLMAEKTALQTQAIVSNGLCGVNSQLGLLKHDLSSITTGCAVRSVPACPSSCSCNA